MYDNLKGATSAFLFSRERRIIAEDCQLICQHIFSRHDVDITAEEERDCDKVTHHFEVNIAMLLDN